MIKLPKQWKHWCHKLNLRPEAPKSRYSRVAYRYFYLVGRGRRFMINCYGEFVVGELYSEFDRWANSTEDTYNMPETFQQFKTILEKHP